ncbi:hypothetical protein [Croceiramulus getboli]|nr:hypothetical protein P8624_13970 [Flavobacteriaceae bacterium YJPT1-3]
MNYLTHMISKSKWMLLILLGFVLLGCPPGHFHAYQFLGDTGPEAGIAYQRIAYEDEVDLLIKVGYLYEFINERENGMVVLISRNLQEGNLPASLVQQVYSSSFGPLQRVNEVPYTARVLDSTHTLMYSLFFPKTSEKKALERIAIDTIRIQLQNDRMPEFVRLAQGKN